MVRPMPWWACPACSGANDADLERCAKCGAPRPTLCNVPGCGRPRDRSGLCPTHRTRFTRWGVGAALAEPRSYSSPPDPVPAVLGRSRRSGDGSTGQALVEFVLILPVLLMLVLASVDLWSIGYQRTRYQESAGVLADAIAWNGYEYPSPEFDALADDELARVRCDRDGAVTVDDDGWRVVVGLTCRYHPIAYAPLAVPVSVEAAR